MPEKTARQFIRNAAALLALLAAPTAAAHDFWIEPASFRAASGARVPLRLYVGQDLEGESVPYIPELIERYVATGARGTTPIRAVTGDDPAGAAAIEAPGLTVVAYQSRPFDISFDTLAEFERYLRSEGLERQLAAAAQRARLPIREHYTRHAKALIASGAATGPDRPLGLTLELVAERLPPARGGELAVQLLYRGRPLAGALVVASNRAFLPDKLRVRTGADGRARLALPRAGMWLVTAVHMVDAPFYARHDWESLWASLTFEVGG